MTKELETKVAILQKDVDNIKEIHGRLDNAIEKISDVTSAINRMLAVHEEKLHQQEDAILEGEKNLEIRRKEFSSDVMDLHGRITSMQEKITKEMTLQHKQNEALITSMQKELVDKVNSLEKFRWIIFGGMSVFAGMASWASTFFFK